MSEVEEVARLIQSKIPEVGDKMRLTSGEIVPWDNRYQLDDLAELPCITTATFRERERCAKIVESDEYDCRRDDPARWSETVAAKIRSGE